MGPSERRADFAIAAAIVAIAVAVSPIGIRLATGRLDLSPRIGALSLTFDLFLLILAGAVLARGRARHAAFHLMAWTFPLVLLAAIEIGAIAVHLADRIAPLEDLSVLADKDRWPPYLMSLQRKVVKDGVRLYRPWQGDGISINELGLRTAMPSPKAAGEWRIAVTGGSAAWGWRVLDADTIPVQMQQLLRRQGHSNVTVYNFAIDTMVIEEELKVLKRFRDVYAVDQVVFYTGGNDAASSYMSAAAPQVRFGGLLSGATAFELINAAGRLKAKLFGPSPGLLAELDNAVLPALARSNSLRDGLIAAAEYCRALSTRCDVVLQPTLIARKAPRGPEIGLAHTIEQIYPRYRELFAAIYRSARNTGLPIHDRSDLFDRSVEPYFFDVVHVNEAGNRLAAERIAEIVSGAIPTPRPSHEHTSH